MPIDPTRLQAQMAALALNLGWRAYNTSRLVLGFALLGVLETYSAWYAFASAPKQDLWSTPWGEFPRAAIIHGGMSAGFGVLAFLILLAAGNLAQDERPRVRAGAFFATLLGLGAMLTPIGNLGNAMDYDDQLAHWEAVRASPEYQVKLAIVNDPGADSREQRLAAEALTKPTTADFNPLKWLLAAFFHGIVAFSARVRLPPPVTQEEKDAMERERREALAEQKRKERNDLIRKLHRDGHAPSEIAKRMQDLGHEDVNIPVVNRVLAKPRARKPAKAAPAKRPMLAVFGGGKA